MRIEDEVWSLDIVGGKAKQFENVVIRVGVCDTHIVDVVDIV